jgi:hypothetical protein
MNNLPAFKNALEDMGFNNVDMSFNQDSNQNDQNNEQQHKYIPIEEAIEEEIEEVNNINLKIPVYM